MKDREYLIWLHRRLNNVFKEGENMDYMHKLRALIKATPKDRVTSNIGSHNNLESLLLALIESEE